MHQDPIPRPLLLAQREEVCRRHLNETGDKAITIFAPFDTHAILRQQVLKRHLPAADVIKLALRELSDGGKS